MGMGGRVVGELDDWVQKARLGAVGRVYGGGGGWVRGK